jgi:biotin synthase
MSEGPAQRWFGLAERVLEGHRLTFAEGLSILASTDRELPALLAAAYELRSRRWGNEVQLYYLRNAKSGLCPEDCGYCSQSKISSADIPKYRFNDEETLLASARQAAATKARTFCIVASGRGPSEKDVDHVVRVVQRIKAETPLNVCVCLGLLKPEQAERLAAAGVDRVNHNLNTSKRYYAEICSTHTFDDRLDTLKAVRSSGMELCSGGIVGMGEEQADVVEMALTLAELGVESIPVNFLHPIDGTPLGGKSDLTPRDCLRALCLFRFANPEAEIRIAGGRELHLRWLQPQGLYAANSMFVSDYLTTKGQRPEDDYRLIEDLGFQITEFGPETAKGMAALAEQDRSCATDQHACQSGGCGGHSAADAHDSADVEVAGDGDLTLANVEGKACDGRGGCGGGAHGHCGQ